MGDFDLDLRAVEEQIDADEDGDWAGDIVLGVLDGTTDPDEWRDLVADGNVLVLAVEGDLNELAAGFARDVNEGGGDLISFREFLIVAPAGVRIDTERLS